MRVPPNSCGEDISPFPNWIFFALEEILQERRVDEKAVLLMHRRLVSRIDDKACNVEFGVSAPNDVQLEEHCVKPLCE